MATHDWTADTEALAREALSFVEERLRRPKDARWGAGFIADLHEAIDGSITERGAGGARAFDLFANTVLPACRPNDSPMMLSYVPTAPTQASKIMDVMLGATSIFGSHWEAGAGAIAAENAALRWLSDCVGFPPGAGGCFVPGGSAANLSALVAARESWRDSTQSRPDRPAVAGTAGAHASVRAAARVMDCDYVEVATDECGRMRVDALDAVLSGPEGERVFAVVASAGTTSVGAVDPINDVAEVCDQRGGLWLHVDAAYGGAAACSPNQRHRLDGIWRASSVGIDPHKWLFAPYDCGAVVYREPRIAAKAHAQRADYLSAIDRGEWNPSDFAFHLSRRARGLPLWFSLVVNGTASYAASIDETFRIAELVATGVRTRSDQLNLLLDPDLTILLVARRGWSTHQYVRWADAQSAAGRVLLQPFEWNSKPCIRMCIVNPTTSTGEMESVLDDLASAE